MRLMLAAIGSSVAVVLLAGCSGNASSPNASPPNSGMPSGAALLGLAPYGNTVNVIPKKYLPVRIKVMRRRQTTAFPMKGIYVSQLSSTSLYGFPKNNSANAEPFCSTPATDVQGFGVDNSGDLMLP
jgi:hypothetical protein